MPSSPGYGQSKAGKKNKGGGGFGARGPATTYTGFRPQGKPAVPVLSSVSQGFHPQGKPATLPLSRAQQNAASKAASGALAPFLAAMANITPGMIQDTHLGGTKPASAAGKAGSKPGPKPSAVARRLGVSGAGRASGPVAPPVDPLDTLQKEYGGYLSGVYGGLQTALGANAEQYKTRSQEIADRLKAQYGDAANVIGDATRATQSDLEAFAQRMGLQQATQGQTTQDWVAQNERLKALNAAAEANSLGTNDVIRSNYYDFLVDKVSSAKSAEATSQASLLDLVSQAKLQRLQAQQAAAAAAASRRRSSGGRGGGGGSSGSSGTQSTSTKITSTNDAEAAWMAAHPDWAASQLANIPAAKSYLDANTYNASGTSYANMNPRVNSASAGPVISPNAIQQAIAYATQTGGYGGPKTSSTVTINGKKVKLS